MINQRFIRTFRSSSKLGSLSQNQAIAQPLTDKTRTIDSLPGPPRIPGFGSYWLIENILIKSRRDKLHEHQIGLQKKYGNYVNLSSGPQKLVAITCPKVMEEAIRREDKGLPIRPSAIGWKLYLEEENLRPGLLTAQHKQWKENRHSVSPVMLKTSSFDAHEDVIQDIVTEFTDSLQHRSDETGFVDEMPMKLMHLTHEIITQVLFGIRLNSSGQEPSERALIFLKAINLIVADSFNQKAVYMPLMKKFNTKGWKEHKDAWNEVIQEVKDLTSEAILSKDRFEQDGYAPLIFQLMERHDTDILATLSELLMGGVDTTSNLLGFILSKLAENPEKQEKLRAEVMTLGDRKSESRYVRLVVKETARLFPVIPFWSRRIEREFTSDHSGIVFPRGVEVLFNHYALCRDPDNFSQADEFIPERFDRETTTADSPGRKFVSIPFGFGIRSCIGRRLAELEMYQTIADIVSKYRVELVEGMKLDPVLRGVLTPGKQLPVRFIPLKRQQD